MPDNYDTPIFVKFLSQKRIESFLAGNLYMPSLQHFIDLEEKKDKQGQGDKNEGSVSVFQNLITSPYMQTKISLRYSPGYTNIPVFCIMLLSLNNDSKNYELTREQYNEMRSFSKYCVVVYDIAEFIRRFEVACNQLKYEFKHMRVFYNGQNLENDKAVKEMILGNEKYKSIFQKDKRFSLQNEYQFAIFEEIKCPLTLNIGNISDIAKQHTIDDFLIK